MSDSDFETKQTFLATKGLVALFDELKRPKEDVLLLAEKVDHAVDDYRRMLISGTLDARQICLAGKQLGDELRAFGLDHEHFMEYARGMMSLGYYAGFFGVYMDYSLAAERGDLD